MDRGGPTRLVHDRASNSWCMQARTHHAMPRLTTVSFAAVHSCTAIHVRQDLHGCIWTVQSTRSSFPSISTVHSSSPSPNPSSIDIFPLLSIRCLSPAVFFVRISNLPNIRPKLGAISNDAIVHRRADGGISLLSCARARMQEAHEHKQGCQEVTWTHARLGRWRRRSPRTETGTIRSEQQCQQEDPLATFRKRRDQGAWNASKRVGIDARGRKSASVTEAGKQRTRGKTCRSTKKNGEDSWMWMAEPRPYNVQRDETDGKSRLGSFPFRRGCARR